MDENSALKTQNLTLLFNSERIKIITLGNCVHLEKLEILIQAYLEKLRMILDTVTEDLLLI